MYPSPKARRPFIKEPGPTIGSKLGKTNRALPLAAHDAVHVMSGVQYPSNGDKTHQQYVSSVHRASGASGSAIKSQTCLVSLPHSK
jgi:hypothetical protein